MFLKCTSVEVPWPSLFVVDESYKVVYEESTFWEVINRLGYRSKIEKTQPPRSTINWNRTVTTHPYYAYFEVVQ